MRPRRLLVYALVALPLIALALFVRIRHENQRLPPAPRSSATRLYLQAVGAACDRATRAAAPKGHVSAQALAVGLARLNPAPGYWDAQAEMVDALRVARNTGFDGDLVAQFNNAAASLGVADCIMSDNARPGLAYPPAPRHGGRTALGWNRFAAAIDGICADNSSRTFEAAVAIERAARLTRGQKNFALVQLNESSHRRLLRLFSRLGQPPDDSRPYQGWIKTVTARTHAYARQADADDMAEVHQLDERIAELNGHENWYGEQIGLRVCSANGPAVAP